MILPIPSLEKLNEDNTKIEDIDNGDGTSTRTITITTIVKNQDKVEALIKQRDALNEQIEKEQTNLKQINEESKTTI